jgi:glucose/arabinose dehydrogenase
MRNGEGFAFDAAGRLFVTHHGRDQLSQDCPSLETRFAQRLVSLKFYKDR